MKTLNKNWFAFTLIAVIFGILGFLLGKTCQKQDNCMMKNFSKHRVLKGHHGALTIRPTDSMDQSRIEIEEELGKDGAKIMKIEVTKEKE